MINIKMFTSPKKNGSSGGDITNSTTNVTNITNALSDRWFYYDSDNNAVGCKYNFYSVGSVSANGVDTEGSTAGQLQVVDNLNSTDPTKALSANQGRVLKDLIDNIESGSSGQALNSCDWSDVTNKPNTFTPSAHTHSMNDVNGLQSQLSFYSQSVAAVSQNLEAHTTNQSIHIDNIDRNVLDILESLDLTKLTQLLNLINITNNNVTFNGSVFTTNDVTANT